MLAFRKYKDEDKWYCLLPWLDSASKDEIEKLLERLKISFNYVFCPHAEIRKIRYMKHKFTLVLDLVYGAELRTNDIDSVNIGVSLAGKLISSHF